MVATVAVLAVLMAGATAPLALAATFDVVVDLSSSGLVGQSARLDFQFNDADGVDDTALVTSLAVGGATFADFALAQSGADPFPSQIIDVTLDSPISFSVTLGPANDPANPDTFAFLILQAQADVSLFVNTGLPADAILLITTRGQVETAGPGTLPPVDVVVTGSVPQPDARILLALGASLIAWRRHHRRSSGT